MIGILLYQDICICSTVDCAADDEAMKGLEKILSSKSTVLICLKTC